MLARRALQVDALGRMLQVLQTRVGEQVGAEIRDRSPADVTDNPGVVVEIVGRELDVKSSPATRFASLCRDDASEPFVVIA